MPVLPGHIYNPLTDAGNSGTALTINWDDGLGIERNIVLTGNVTFTFQNPQSGGRYVFLIDTGAGGFTVTWPATVMWSRTTGLGPPVITVAAGSLDLVVLIYSAIKAKYYGSYIQNYLNT